MNYIEEYRMKLIDLYFDRYYLRRSFRQIRKKLGDKPLIGAEIGVRYGYNSRRILKYLNMEKLYLIDPWESGKPGYKDHSFEKAQKTLRRHNSKVVFVRKSSWDAVDDIPDNLDFVYIDGSHKYEDVLKDIELYYPKLSKDGILCGHDYDSPYVSRAVTEFATKNDIDLMTLFCYPKVDWFYGFNKILR